MRSSPYATAASTRRDPQDVAIARLEHQLAEADRQVAEKRGAVDSARRELVDMRRAADAAATRPEEIFLRQGLRHARLGDSELDRAPDAPTPSDIAHALRTRRMMPPVLCRR